MDGTRFDNLARRLATGTSRRAILKGVLAGVTGSLTGLAGTVATDQRAREQPSGAPCITAGDCASLICANGVCCETACAGQCESCATGACQPVTGAPDAGKPACPGEDDCQASCDGTTTDACTAFPGAETPCGESTCTDGWQTTSACAGNGSCTPTTTACAPAGCNAEGTACASGCTTDADCAPGSSCAEDGQCLPADGLGTPCAADPDCQTGVCVDGVCCVERCGECQVCNLQGNEGFCGPGPDGTACAGGTCCEGGCVDVQTDVEHCGACGVACTGAVCQVAVCAAGVCGTEPMPDDTPCGEGQVCLDGACGCPGGLTACDGTCVDTQTNLEHCGACHNACIGVENGVAVCDGGVCGFTCLPVEFKLCDDACIPADACCTAADCVPTPGICQGAATCEAGVCVFAPATDGTCREAADGCHADAVCDGQSTGCPPNPELCSPARCCAGQCCPEDQRCDGETCVPICLALGDVCTADEECCQDARTVCRDGYEHPSGIECCRPFGSACTGWRDCCLVFAEQHGAEVNVNCGDDQTCASVGAGCTWGEQCASGRCTDGVCVAACDEGTEPCGDSCCAAGEVCADNICQPCGNLNNPCCPPDNTCIYEFHFCNADTICQACGSPGEPCCPPDNTCFAGSCTDGICQY